MLTETKTIVVPHINIPKMMSRINRWQQKAAKWGLDPIVCKPIGDTTIKSGSFTLPATEFEFASPIIAIPDWEFIATIDYTLNRPNARTVPGKECPREFVECEPRCDHCSTIRSRKETFVVHNTKTDEYKLVGRSCLQDYLGVDPETLTWTFEMMWYSPDEVDEGSFRGLCTSGEVYIDVTRFLELAACTIRNVGFMSKSKHQELWEKAENNEGPYPPPMTQGIIVDYLFPGDRRQSFREMHGFDMEPTEEDQRTVEEAVAWVMSESVNSDYIYTLQNIVQTGKITWKYFGYASSLIAAYHRSMEREKVQQERNKHRVSEHLGQVKDRLSLKVKVITVKAIDGMYGLSWLHRMVDEDTGAELTWFCTSEDAVLEEGRTYAVKATVKKHDSYNGVKQTLVNRVKVEEAAAA